ncbi:MAG TPA: VOC family protein [Gaiellaceae bacterium]
MTSITPYLLYTSCEDALDYLHRAFGFEEVLRYNGPEGYVTHAEMRIDGVPIMMGNPGEGYRNPRELGQETVGVYVEVDDSDAVYERASAAGAEIVDEPNDRPYGHRTFTARDPEGHYWYFAHVIADVPAEEWGAQVADVG